MEWSREQEKEVEVKRMTDEIKNKCYIGIRGVYTTGVCVKGIELSSKLSLPF